MPLAHELYSEQVKVWPKDGRHILAHYDDESIVVYQAYNPAIGRYAIEHGRFGGGFSFSQPQSPPDGIATSSARAKSGRERWINPLCGFSGIPIIIPPVPSLIAGSALFCLKGNSFTSQPLRIRVCRSGGRHHPVFTESTHETV